MCHLPAADDTTKVFTNAVPFSHLRDGQVIMQVVIEKRTPPRPQLDAWLGLTNEIWELMQHCWSYEPEERPSMNDVMSKISRYCCKASPSPRESIPRRMDSIISTDTTFKVIHRYSERELCLHVVIKRKSQPSGIQTNDELLLASARLAEAPSSLSKAGPYFFVKTLKAGKYRSLKLGKHEKSGKELTVKLIRIKGTTANLEMEAKVRQEIKILSVRHLISVGIGM